MDRELNFNLSSQPKVLTRENNFCRVTSARNVRDLFGFPPVCDFASRGGLEKFRSRKKAGKIVLQVVGGLVNDGGASSNLYSTGGSYSVV